MKKIVAKSKTEYVLRALFLGHYRPLESKNDAVTLTLGYALAGYAAKKGIDLWKTALKQHRENVWQEGVKQFLDTNPFLNETYHGGINHVCTTGCDEHDAMDKEFLAAERLAAEDEFWRSVIAEHEQPDHECKKGGCPIYFDIREHNLRNL